MPSHADDAIGPGHGTELIYSASISRNRAKEFSNCSSETGEFISSSKFFRTTPSPFDLRQKPAWLTMRRPCPNFVRLRQCVMCSDRIGTRNSHVESRRSSSIVSSAFERRVEGGLPRADQIDMRKFQAFGCVQGDQSHAGGLFLLLFAIAIERDFVEEMPQPLARAFVVLGEAGQQLARVVLAAVALLHGLARAFQILEVSASTSSSLMMWAASAPGVAMRIFAASSVSAKVRIASAARLVT